MGIQRNKIYWLLIILIYLPNVKTSCMLTELPKEGDLCSANLECNQVISFNKTQWDCIQHEQDVYKNDYYYNRHFSHRVTVYDENFNFYVKMENVDDQTDIFQSDTSFVTNIKKLHIYSGNWLTVPEEIYKLSEITEIEIANNQLSSVNLNNFASISILTEIILKNNEISTLETDVQNKQASRSIETIDLSFNRLRELPNTCFSLFTGLKYLDLSYNQISSFDILTFEGVMELQTLNVAHNMLHEIGNSLTRFVNLKELMLENNKLSKLQDYNFNTLANLNKLNLKSNKIETIENNTFKHLLLLEYLDISNNSLVSVTKNLFQNNTKLTELYISDNHVKNVEDGAFAGLSITKFDIRNNNLTGNIGKDYFRGIHVTAIDISNGSITSLGNEAFKYMCKDLNSLNVSFNKINAISATAFTCLENLNVLDLSHNTLKNINFDTNGLLNLTSLQVNHNKIEKIPILSNLTSLKTIDLSYNEIRDIDQNPFSGLHNIETLSFTHNPFVLTLKSNTFYGLSSLQQINLANTRTISYENRSFSGLPSLRHVNASFGQLSNLAYNTFVETDSLETLDLSNNLLSNFHINTTSILKIKEIFLDNNLIRYLSNNTFSGLTQLRRLSLIQNDLQRIEAHALKDLVQLSHLLLSSNKRMQIIGNPFDNLTNLFQVNMDKVMTNFTFKSKTSIENLDLHMCGIKDLKRLSLSQVSELRELRLSSNKIEKIDKFSFQSLPFLVKLDLSSNLISFIQPGSFLHVSNLRNLSLFENNLEILQFGVFDGAKNLNFVNLSSNSLQSFDIKLLPAAKSIALDSNMITNLDFQEFFKSSIVKLSIGGNKFSCKVLAEYKSSNYSETFKNLVTSAKLDFHSENVDGISCQSVKNNNEVIIPVVNNTGYDVRPVLTKFTNAIDNFHKLIEQLESKIANDESQQKKTEITGLLESIKTLVNISNHTQINSDNYYKNFEFFANLTQTYFKNVTKQIVKNTDDKYVRASSDKSNYQNNKDNDEMRLEIKKMLKVEIDAIRDEFGKTIENYGNKPQSQIINSGTRDDKVLYFIAASLGIIIIMYILNLLYVHFRKTSFNSLHSSRRPITSEIEME